jgi:HrpA-like RNA helicase
VDYVASGTKTANPKAKIVFKLDRLVLDELVESPTLDEYSCLVIDEAHERTISIDVILGLVKELLQKRKNFKVIITSASMEISLFEKYFNTKTLKVSGRMFPVNVQYLPSKEEDTVKKIEKAIDNELLTERNMLKDKYKGHILVFCADTSEIEALTEIFKRKLNHNVFMVIPLHGKLTPEEQRKAFSKTKEHKLIFASRIAETAITIDGVKVVIDPGWDREMQYDQKTKFSSMKLVEISQSSAKQRAGRAGRTQEGYCLRLYSKYLGKPKTKQASINKKHCLRNFGPQTKILRR